MFISNIIIYKKVKDCKRGGEKKGGKLQNDEKSLVFSFKISKKS
jgi:hypothetical protein